MRFSLFSRTSKSLLSTPLLLKGSGVRTKHHLANKIIHIINDCKTPFFSTFPIISSNVKGQGTGKEEDEKEGINAQDEGQIISLLTHTVRVSLLPYGHLRTRVLYGYLCNV